VGNPISRSREGIGPANLRYVRTMQVPPVAVIWLVGAGVPLVGAPLYVVLSGIGLPYGINSLALVLVGPVYLPVGLLAAGAAVGLRALTLLKSSRLEPFAVLTGAIIGAGLWSGIFIVLRAFPEPTAAVIQCLAMGTTVGVLSVTGIVVLRTSRRGAERRES
jgi:hypothetical protein